jgi:hypothetical protein
MKTKTQTKSTRRRLQPTGTQTGAETPIEVELAAEAVLEGWTHERVIDMLISRIRRDRRYLAYRKACNRRTSYDDEVQQDMQALALAACWLDEARVAGGVFRVDQRQQRQDGGQQRASHGVEWGIALWDRDGLERGQPQYEGEDEERVVHRAPDPPPAREIVTHDDEGDHAERQVTRDATKKEYFEWGPMLWGKVDRHDDCGQESRREQREEREDAEDAGHDDDLLSWGRATRCPDSSKRGQRAQAAVKCAAPRGRQDAALSPLGRPATGAPVTTTSCSKTCGRWHSPRAG